MYWKKKISLVLTTSQKFGNTCSFFTFTTLYNVDFYWRHENILNNVCINMAKGKNLNT